MRLNKRGDRRGMNTATRDITGPKNAHWKGGVVVRFDGYVMVRRDKKTGRII